MKTKQLVTRIKDNKKALTVISIAVMLAVAGGIAVYMQFGGGSPEETVTTNGDVDTTQKTCAEIYDEILNSQRSVESLPERCEPLPDDVERQLYAQALQEQ